MSDIISGAALGPAGPVVKKALDALEPTIRKGAGSLAKHLTDKVVANLQIGFTNYLCVSYDRCRSVKTLLSQDRPLALLDIYVNLYLECGDRTLQDDNLIMDLESYGRIVITGLAGCGKSMFMKYLTICRFENSRGKIPLFVELRNINSLTSKSLIAYIHETCALAGNRVSYDQFELALRAGGMLLILDGFDEIDFAHRDEISGQILEISTKYPDVPIVVSSRPDEKFMSWQNFYTFRVMALEKKQVLRLISKIDYDDELKKRFRREVDRHLYASHTSFLSSPLLASIMLLTYEQFAEIPTKMHIFYEQAFGVLFRRHDAQKAQFIRKTYANLAIDAFKNFFSAFCAASYLQERFSFTDKELRELAQAALKFAGISPNVDHVIRDLCECVCMLQRDGIDTVFVHRSFQEYFCAVFVAAYNGPQLRPMLDKISKRYEDQVISMLFEMARDKVDLEWVIPHLDEMLENTAAIDDDLASIICKRLITRVGMKIDLKGKRKKEFQFEYAFAGDEYWVYGTISRLYPKIGFFERVVLTVISGLREMADRGEELKQLNATEFSALRGAPHLGEDELQIAMTPRAIELLGLQREIVNFVRELAELKGVIEKRIGAKDVLVESLFTRPSRTGGPEVRTDP